MALMGEEDCSEKASSYSWWWESHNHHHHQSQWLQATLSDLDKKIKVMLNLIKDQDGDSFAERAEMYYQRRPELVKMVEDLHRSYRSLAEKYNQLRSESTEAANNSKPLSNSFQQAQHLQINSIGSSDDQNPNPEFEPSSLDLEYLSRLADELISAEASKNSKKKAGGIGKKIDGGIESDSDKWVNLCSGSEQEEMWNELRIKISELMEDNLRQQAELIRRNDEKREAIKALCIEINRLMEENRALKSCLAHHKLDKKQNQSPMSRMKGMILGKLLR